MCPALLQIVIVVEGTRAIDFLFGVIIAVVCSNWIAALVHTDGVYESELDNDTSVSFLRQEPPHGLRTLTAIDVCHPRIYPHSCRYQITDQSF